MIIDNPKLQFANPWWELPEAIKQDKKLLEFAESKIKYYHPLYFNLPRQDVILTLRGPRQIGKTTLFKLLVRKLLLEEKVARENVFYYACDMLKEYEMLYLIVKEYLDALRAENRDRAYLFLDEISFVYQWQRALKALSDSYLLENTTVCLTGSNIIDITYSSERLPGRRGELFKPDIDFHPLTFNQFITLVEPEVVKQPLLHKLPKLRRFFRDYLLCGGFPKTINEYYEKGFIKAATYEAYLKWIEGDLHKVGRSEETAYRLLKRVLKSYCSPVSYYKLAKEAGLASYTSAQEYLEILQRMFIVVILPYFSLDQKKVDDKKNKKIYLADPFIRNAIASQIEGFLAEAFDYSRKKILVGNKLSQLVEEVSVTNLSKNFVSSFYGKSGKKEIDLVGLTRGEYYGYEVKYQKQISTKEFNWLKNLPLHQPIVVLTKKDTKHGKQITLAPAELYLAQEQHQGVLNMPPPPCDLSLAQNKKYTAACI